MIGDARELSPSAMRLAARRLCIVMVCADDEREADQIARLLTEFDNGCLVIYRRAEDLWSNGPAGKVALVILASAHSPSGTRRTLKWLRERWPRCPVTIVGDSGCGDHEMAAREGGAIYLTRPVSHEQWQAVLNHAVGSARRETDEMRERFEAPDASRPI